MRERILLALLLVILTVAGCGTRNQSPTLLSFTASNTRLYIGEIVELQVVASDPEGQPLSVTWSTDQGSFVQIRGDQASWTSQVAGNHTVQVEVVDPFGGTARGVLRLEVMDHVVLPAGTQITTRLLRDVYADMVRIGDLVPLRVVEPIYVDGYEVITEGADALGQVLYVQPAVNGSGGLVVLAPTLVQLTDGQLISVDPARSSGDGNGAVLGLAGTEFSFTPGSPPIVRSGALLRGITPRAVQLRVDQGRILDRPVVNQALIGTQACLGIHGVDFSEYVLSLFTDGVRIEGFESGSGAAKSGLQIGDRLYGIRIGSEEYPIENLADLRRVERLLQPGDEAVLMVRNLLRRADVPLRVDTCYTVLPTAAERSG